MLLLVLSVSAEIEAWGRLAPQGPGATRAELVFRARVALSAVWALLAGGFVALGFRARSADWRWGGLLLFAATVVKVFLVDMETLQTGYRVGAFLALGVLMVGTSFFYQRGMRDGAGPDAA
jgi:uncharacterized membrane protein